MPPNEPRVPPLPESEWTDEIREILGRAGGATGTPVQNIFATLAHHPKLLKRWLVFGTHVLVRSSLPPRERELLILRTGWRWGAEYEWAQHARIGKQAGLTDEEIRRTAHAGEEGWAPADALLVRAVDELVADGVIGDATWKALAERYDVPQRIDLVFTVGQYTLVSMALNSLGVQLDPGLEGFPDTK